MRRETRRGLRIIISVLHMIIQALMIWIIVTKLDPRRGHNTEQILLTVQSMLTHISIMIGSFCAYYTIMKLITRRNLTLGKGSSNSDD